MSRLDEFRDYQKREEALDHFRRLIAEIDARLAKLEAAPTGKWTDLATAANLIADTVSADDRPRLVISEEAPGVTPPTGSGKVKPTFGLICEAEGLEIYANNPTSKVVRDRLIERLDDDTIDSLKADRDRLAAELHETRCKLDERTMANAKLTAKLKSEADFVSAADHVKVCADSFAEIMGLTAINESLESENKALRDEIATVLVERDAAKVSLGSLQNRILSDLNDDEDQKFVDLKTVTNRLDELYELRRELRREVERSSDGQKEYAEYVFENRKIVAKLEEENAALRQIVRNGGEDD